MPVIVPDAGLSPQIPIDSPAGVPLIGYDNQVTAISLVSTIDDSDHPVSNLANVATHLFWEAAFQTGGLYSILINLNGVSSVDYIGIAGHNFGSAGIGIMVQGFTGDSPDQLTNLLTSASPGFVTVSDDSPLIIRFTPATYHGLLITLNVGGSTMPRAAVLYAGAITALERSIKVDAPHVPLTYGRATRIVSGMSESGNFLGRLVLSESRVTKAEFSYFTPTFYRNTMEDFLVAAETDPFFWAWAPDDYPLETGYAWLISDPQPEVSPDTLRIALTLEMAGLT